MFSNIEEIIGKELLDDKIKNKNIINAYWGTAPTGEPHIAYLLPLLKVRDMIREKWDVKILIADVHSYMDKGLDNDTEDKANYYEFLIREIMSYLGEDNFTIVKGSEYQLDKKYCVDLYRFSSMVNVKTAQKHHPRLLNNLPIQNFPIFFIH